MSVSEYAAYQFTKGCWTRMPTAARVCQGVESFSRSSGPLSSPAASIAASDDASRASMRFPTTVAARQQPRSRAIA